MDRRSLKAETWLVQGLTVLALVGAMGLYILVYVPAQTAYLTERHFRLLGDLSEQIRDDLVSLHTALTNTAVMWTNMATKWSASDESTNRTDALTNAMAQIEPPVELISCRTTTEPLGALAIYPSRQLPGYSLDWTYASSPAGTKTTNLAIRADLNELLRPILSRYDFEDILLAQTNGEVVYQWSQSELRATNLAAMADLVILELPGFNHNQGSNLVARGTWLEQVSLAGTDYRLFAQPLQVSLGETPDSKISWYVCGLIRERVFRTESWKIHTTAAVIFVFGALGMLLAWPFFNVVFCSPRGDVRRFEAVWVLAASLAACALLTFALLFGNTRLSLHRDLNPQLEGLATNVLGHLSEELAATDRLLTKLDLKLIEAASKPDHSWKDVGEKGGMTLPEFLECPGLIDVAWVDSQGQQIAKWTPQRSVPRLVPVKDRAYFRSLIEGWAWTGEFLSNADTKDSQADTNYYYVESLFTRTRNDNVAIFAHRFPSDRWPTNSPTIPSGPARPRISCLSSRLLSLFNPVLPAGDGFCLIEASGRVLFHSDGRRNLRENLIKETGRDPRLQAAIHNRTADEFDARYLNQHHHLHVTPVPGIPWMLVTFRNMHLVDIRHRAILLAAGALFALYVLALLGLLALVVIGWRKLGVRHRYHDWLAWLWPERRSGARYGVPILVAAAGALACAGGIYLSQSTMVLMAWGVLAPVIVLAASGLTAWRGRVSAPDPCPADDRFDHWGHKVYGGLGFLLLALLPAFACYRIASAKETLISVKATQLELARELQSRPMQMRVRAWNPASGGTSPFDWTQFRSATSSGAPVRTGTNYWAQLRSSRLTHYWSHYFAHFGTCDVLPAADSGLKPASEYLDTQNEWFDPLYEACRPRFDVAELRTSGMLSRSAADHSWTTHFESRGRHLALTLFGGNGLGNPGAIQIHSPLTPRMGSASQPMVHTLGWYLGLLVVLAAPFFFSSFIARELLLLNLPCEIGYGYRGSRHLRFVGPPTDGCDEDADAFAAMEKTYVFERDLTQVRAGRDNVRRMEVGAIIALAHPRGTLYPAAEVAGVAQALDPSRKQIILAVFDSDVSHTDTPDPSPVAPGEEGRALKHSPSPAGMDDFWTVGDVSAEAPRVREFGDVREAVALRLCREYHSIWKRCTAKEKLTLWQVAEHGFISASREEVRTLLDRGLLGFSPELSLRNESFKRFVLATYRAAAIEKELEAQELGETASHWLSIRGAIGAGITVVALFLFVTQKELWQLAVGVAGSFAAASQDLSKVTGLFQKGKAKGQDSEGK